MRRAFVVVCLMIDVASAQNAPQPPTKPAPTTPPPTSGCDPSVGCIAPPTTAPLPTTQPPGTQPPSAQPPGAQPDMMPVQPQPPPQEQVSAGWAHGAGIIGYASAGLIAALTVTIVVENSPDTADTARGLGALTVLYAGVALPVVAIGGHSARHHHLVRGLPGLRIAGWVGYGLSLGDAIVLLALSFDNTISNAQIVSVGFLAALSSLAFGLDANASAGQAYVVNHMAQPTVQPAVTLLRTPDHQTVPALTLTGRF